LVFPGIPGLVVPGLSDAGMDLL
jgi:hypothetical protein